MHGLGSRDQAGAMITEIWEKRRSRQNHTIGREEHEIKEREKTGGIIPEFEEASL